MKIIGERLRVLDLACLVKARQAQVSTCIQFTNPTLRWQVPLPYLQKNDPHRQRAWSRPGLRKNGRFYVMLKCGKLLKICSPPQKTPEIRYKTDIYFGKGNLFNIFKYSADLYFVPSNCPGGKGIDR